MPKGTNGMERTKAKRGRLFVWVVFLLGPAVALAQLPTATILGVVRDSSGAVAPEATLTTRNTETGQTRTAVSAADGSYRFSALPVGSYELRVEHPGFRSQLRSGLTLTVAQEAVVNFALEVGAIEQTVEVRAEAPLVNTTSGSLGGLVNEQKVADLPLNGRNYIDLTLLQPGVQRHRNANSAPITGIAFSSNGAPIRSNNYLLDGASMVSLKGVSAAAVTHSTLGVEGIREYRVVTNSFSAEYGMTMGSQMMIVSKSGTNRFQGSLFEYLRNSALDARNFFDYRTKVAPRRLPAFTRNNFGGSLGGPIQKDSLFFHLVYEGVRERLGLTNVLDVIPPSAKVEGGAGGVTQIAEVVKPLLPLFPDPNLPNNQFTFPFSQPTTENYGQARVDKNISAADTLFVRYTSHGAEQTGLGKYYPEFRRVKTSRSQFVTLSENHVFSPALLNLFRFSYSRQVQLAADVTDLIGPQYSLIPGQPMGRIQIGGITDFGPSRGSRNSDKQNLFTWSDDLFYTRGVHSLKFGTLINHFQIYALSAQDVTGLIVFPTLQAFLQARPGNYNGAGPDSIPDRTYHYSTYGFYLQDDWRVRSGLTLNLGLRYEFNTQVQEMRGHGSALRDIQHDAKATLGPPIINSSLRNVSPRFGFAWDVTGDAKTAVRGGFGLLYDVGNLGNALYQGINGTPPFSSLRTVVNPPSFTIPLVFPPGNAAITLEFPDYLMQQPHILQYNLTVERQLPFQMALSLAYGGSRGINLTQGKEGNPTIPQILPDGRQFWLGNEPRTNPYWDSMRLYTAGGSSWYNSLQFGLTKRLSQGLQFQSSYTWSKIIDEVSSQTGGDNNLVSSSTGVDPNHKNVERGLAAWDVTHNWRFNTIYRLPNLLAATGPGKVLNGWWVSGIVSVESGSPFTPVLNSNRSRSRVSGGAAGIDHPDLTLGRKNENIILGGPTRYYDPLAFTVPPIGFLGTAGRNILRGPGFATVDFSLGKDTALGLLGEGGKLEFRAEFFNLLNRVNFGVPNRTVFAARADVEAPLANAGRITATSSASRQIQLALRFAF